MSSPKRKRQKSSTGLVGTDGRCTFCNKGSGNEILINCEDCGRQMHPSCQELPPSMLEIIQTYSWQCGTCKQCIICHGKGNEELMLLCDHCDRGYHRYCLHSKADLKETREGWICPVCKVPEPPVRVVKDDEPEYEIVTPKRPQKCDLKKDSSSKEMLPLKMEGEEEISSTRSETPVKRRRSTKLSCKSKSAEQNTEDTIPVNKRKEGLNPELTVSPEIKREIEPLRTFGSAEKADRVGKAVRRSLRNSFVKETLEISLIDESCVGSTLESRNSPMRKQPRAIACGSESSESGRKFSSRIDSKFEPNSKSVQDATNQITFHSSPSSASKSSKSNLKKKSSSKEGEDTSFLGETKSNLCSAFDKNVDVFKSPIKTYLLKRGRSPRKSETFDSRGRKTLPSSLPTSAKKEGRAFATHRRRTFSDTDKVTHEESLLHDTPTSIDDRKDTKRAPTEKFRRRSLFTDAHSSCSRPQLEKSPGQCPIKGCDGSGNVDPRYSSHHTAIGCPRVKFLRRKSKSKVMILEPEDDSPIELEAKKESTSDLQRKSYPKRERKFLPETTLYGSCTDASLTTDILSVTERSSPEIKPSIGSPKKAVCKAIVKEERKKDEVRKSKEKGDIASRKQETVKKVTKVFKASPVTKRSQGKIVKPEKKLTPKKKVIGNVTPSPSKKNKERLVAEKGTPMSKTNAKKKGKESNCSKNSLNLSASISDCETALRPLSPITSKDIEAEVDITRIMTQLDIVMFEEARRKAEENLEPEEDDIGDSCIKTIDFGPYEIDTWYVSPYPREYSKLKKLYVCEFCLKYMKSSTILRRHMAKCVIQHPPGDEIYRKGQISVFEVDGEKSKTYCQNLCLLAKLFLDHKTLYYEVGPFLFYVMTEADDKGCHLIGYFSKEKSSFLNYNVACILVMPHYMKKGYGRWLIDFSYVLSQRENKIGTPEHPLSDLGLISYRKYWTDIVLRYLADFQETSISIKEISQKTSIHPNDIVSTLQSLGMVKYWKGKHLLLSKKDLIDAHMKKWEARKKFCPAVDPLFLQWEPKTFVQENTKGPSA